MVNARRRKTSSILVPLSYQILTGEKVTESSLLEVLSRVSTSDALPDLIRFSQYAESFNPTQYEYLDAQVSNLFGSTLGARVAAKLDQSDEFIFFSKWQLLLAVKLVCVFGARSNHQTGPSDALLLRFLLMVNHLIDYHPDEPRELNTDEEVMAEVKKSILRGYVSNDMEYPIALIGRYAEMFKLLAHPANKHTFKSWVDIGQVVETKLGIQLPALKAVLFSLYGNTLPHSENTEPAVVPLPRRMHPEEWFARTQLPIQDLRKAISMVTISPDELREQHLSRYGERVGNAFDLETLLRKPVIRLEDDSLAGLSGHLLIQRYTCGLYWDIHDSLPNKTDEEPNRQLFQTFFGELHEQYGQSVLKRIVDRQTRAGKKVSLATESDYSSDTGRNPDNVLLESVGGSNVRCALFEFKVGRPRYRESLVRADVEAFEEDLRKKIETGLDQEIGLFRQVHSEDREIAGLPMDKVSTWFFVVVVTDPFPAMGPFLEPLRAKLNRLTAGSNTKTLGPFILSLCELEELETLSPKRVTDVLTNWNASTYRDWPFHSYYAASRRGKPIINEHVEKLGVDDMNEVELTLFSDTSTDSPIKQSS